MNDPLAAYRPRVAAAVDNALERHKLHHGGLMRSKLSRLAQSGSTNPAALCLFLTDVFGGQADEAGPAAAAIELLISAYGLQGELLERGTVAEAAAGEWAMPLALNASDGMFALAQTLVLEFVAARDGGRADAIDALDSACAELWVGLQRRRRNEAEGCASASDFIEAARMNRGAVYGLGIDFAAEAAGIAAPAGSATFAGAIGAASALADEFRLTAAGSGNEGWRASFAAGWAADNGDLNLTARLENAATDAARRDILVSGGVEEATREAILRYLEEAEAVLAGWRLAGPERDRVAGAAGYIAKRFLP